MNEDAQFLIPLSRGLFAKVDEEDYSELMKFRWFCSSHGYAVRNNLPKGTRPTTIHMHRQVMGFPQSEVDHRNCDKLDNRRGNLRVASRSQNACNIKTRKDNKAGLKGVYWHPSAKKWAAKVWSNGKNVHVGTFSTPELASQAYKIAVEKLNGEFARAI